MKRPRPKLAAVAALPDPLAFLDGEVVPIGPAPLPTRRERLAAASEAFAFLRRKLRDEMTPESVRVRIATTLVEQVLHRDGSWYTMPGEEPHRLGFRPEDDPNGKDPNGEDEP